MIGRLCSKAAWVFLLLSPALLLPGCTAASSGQPSLTPTSSDTPSRTLTWTPAWTPTDTATSTRTPTPTTIPVKDRDLAAVVLQASEIADFYSEEARLSGPSCMEDIYSEYAEVHENLVNGFNRTFLNIADLSFYTSSIFVYPDEKAARNAYRKIVRERTGKFVEIPVIGTESYADLMFNLYYSMFLMEVVWRDGETVLDLVRFAIQTPTADEMVRLARGIQSRLDNPPAQAQPVTPSAGGGSGRIAFISENKLFTIQTDGTGKTCIANRNPTSFAFSPDGKRVAFTSTTGGCQDINQDQATCEWKNEIYSVRNDGTELTLLAETQTSKPIWSPDGKKILYTTTELIPYTTNNYMSYISIMDYDGRGQKELAEGGWNYGWSPDGKKIAFDCSEKKNGEVCIMNVDGGDQTYLTRDPAYDYFIQWSPDGSKILFKSDREDKKYGTYIMDADGGNPRKLFLKSEETASESWSPDGKKIVYVYYYRTDIYSINADASGDRRLTDHIASDTCPAWSADGTKIIFLTKRNGPREIFIMNEDGSDQKLLAWMGGEIDICPVWVPI